MRGKGFKGIVMTACCILFGSFWIAIFVNTLSEGTSLTAATTHILWPLDTLQAKAIKANQDVYFALYLLLATVWIWISPIYSIASLIDSWNGRKANKLPQLLAEEQLRAVMKEVNSSGSTGSVEISPQARYSVVTLIKHFEKGVREMFDLKHHHQYHMIWYVATNDPLNPVVWSKKGDPSQEEQNLINWAFSKGWATCRDDVQKSNLYNGQEVEAVVSARNIDEFQIGFVLLMYNKVRIPVEKVTEFQTSAASLLMLGQMDNIRQAMLQLTPADWKAVVNP